MPKINRIFNTIKRLGQKVKSNISHEFLTYLVFLLIAIAIWYINALNKDYTTDLTLAVKYTDLPEDKVLVNNPPERLTLTVAAQGFTLLRYRFGKIFYPLILEANYQTLRKNNNSIQGEYFLLTQSVSDKIVSQLKSDIVLKFIVPDTLKFQFSETVRKDLPVISTVQLQFEKGFLPKGKMNIEPGAVTVIGPQSVIDTMKHVYTQSKIYNRLKDTLRTTIKLQPIHQIRYSTDEVTVIQVIERHTEATISLPVEPINTPEDLTMKVFPGTVTVNCMVPVVDYDKLQPYMFRAVVDYISVKDVKDNQAKAKVSIVRTPDFVTDVKFHPMSVDFIIEK